MQPSRVAVLTLKSIRAYDQLRLRARAARQPGFEIHPAASSNFASARYDLAPGSRLRIEAGAVTDRLAGALHFALAPNAEVTVGEGTWLRTDIGDVHVIAFAGARMQLGPECLFNACHLSCKSELSIGRRAMLGPGSRVFDSDQHDFDADRAEAPEPVKIGECVWIASDVTVLKGVTIGDHSVIGTRSLVVNDIPAHTLAFGQPARGRGTVGDRSNTR